MLLHLLHFLLNASVEFVFKLKRLHVIHVAIAVKQVSLKSGSRLFLRIPGSFGIFFIVSVTTVPTWSVWFPGSQTNPTELCLTALVLTNHVVATTIFLDRNVTLGTLLGIGGDPVWCFWVIVTLFYPFSQETTFYRIVPVFTTVKTKGVSTFAGHGFRFDVLHLYCIIAIWRRTPPQEPVALLKNKNFKIKQQFIFYLTGIL